MAKEAAQGVRLGAGPGGAILRGVSHEEERPVTFDEALVIAREIGESLGGRQQRALEVLSRYASRGRKPSALRLDAVHEAAFGAQHFAAARHGLEAARQELDAGMRAIGTAAHVIREVDDAEAERGPEPPDEG